MSTNRRLASGMSRHSRPTTPLMREDVTEKMVTLGLQIPASDHRALKQLAAEQGQSMSAYVRQAIREVIANNGRI